MAKNTEIEFKNLLTEVEYERLLTTFSFQEKELKKQTNIYFDTEEGEMRRLKQGLRIRLLPDKNEFTLKVPTNDSYTYLEITDYLDKFDPNKPLQAQSFQAKSEVFNYLKEHDFPVDSLKEIGSLTTVRGEKQLDEETLLVLDQSFYYGTTDYELEMEVSSSVEGSFVFDAFLKTHEIPIRPAKKKIARMFERKQQVMA